MNLIAALSRRLYSITILVGFNPAKFVRAVYYLPRFIATLFTYRRKAAGGLFPLRFSQLFPVLDDFDQQAGTASGYYFHQDLWAAQRIHAAHPATHVDVGSRIDGFIAHLLTFMPVKVIDIRPLSSSISRLTFIQGDATRLSLVDDNSIESLSSLHAIEHFGLGRYGDPINPDACFAAMHELERILKPGGRLYFSVPIGVQRVQFNAHRVFDPQTILQAFKELDLISFSAIDDAGNLHTDADPENFNSARFACGLFEFRKKQARLDTTPVLT